MSASSDVYNEVRALGANFDAARRIRSALPSEIAGRAGQPGVRRCAIFSVPSRTLIFAEELCKLFRFMKPVDPHAGLQRTHVVERCISQVLTAPLPKAWSGNW